MMSADHMTDVPAPAVAVPEAPPARAFRWLRSKDPELLVLKRSVRAAIVMPSVFALAHFFWSNAQVGLFAAFGCVGFLLFVEFTGRPAVRFASYTGLYVAGAGLVALGTVASTHEAAAVVTMFVVGFGVLFAGIVSPPVATASTAVLLTFVLPVAVAEPASQTGPRLLGWTLAAAVSIPACLVLWPPPWHDNLRRRLSAAISAVARLADARARGDQDPSWQEAVAREQALLRAQFSATPYPPTGAVSGAVALSKLVGRVEWVSGNTALLGDGLRPTMPAPSVRVTEQVADTLHRAAALLCDGDGHPVRDPVLIKQLQDANRRLDELITTELQQDIASVTAAPASDTPRVAGESVASALDPGFRARGLGLATEMVADAALEAAGVEGVIDRLMGAADVNVHAFRHRVLSHLSFHSIWFRNSLRGAIGLALAVMVVELINAQHGFWVVLGTLSVLRSNALGTGAIALRAVWGTAIGFVVGSAIMVGVADHTVLLWVLLPLAVVVAGTAPAMIGFAAGQAAFTVTVIILFNIIEPVGWKVGLTRIEDVAIGCGVSVVVGLLFWPRGATAALGRALSGAFVTGSGYLADAVDRLTKTSREVDTAPAQQASFRSYLLLDDAYRQFLVERGAKVVPVETIARLFTGSNRLRLAAYTLATLPFLPPDPDRPEVESVAIAEAVLRDSYATTHRWYEMFGELLADQRPALDPLPPHDEVLHDALRTAFDDVRAQHRDDRVLTTLLMLWADELLDNQSQMQTDLLASASLFVHKRRGVLV
jgi:uncharacterized membrane protein YccC